MIFGPAVQLLLQLLSSVSSPYIICCISGTCGAANRQIWFCIQSESTTKAFLYYETNANKKVDRKHSFVYTTVCLGKCSLTLRMLDREINLPLDAHLRWVCPPLVISASEQI